MDKKALDRIMYEAYSQKIKEIFKLEDDIVMRWIDLPQELRDGWSAAEKAVLEWMDDYGE